MRKVIAPDELIDRYASPLKMQMEELTRKGRQSTERAMLMEFLYRFCRITQAEIGGLLGGIDYSAVSQARKRMRLKTQREPELRKKYEMIQKQLGQLSS